MGALFNQRAIREHADLVGVADRRQPVRDHDCRPLGAAQELVECELHHALRLSVKRRSRLVQDQNGWLAHQRTSDCDALLLTARQLYAFIANLRRIARRHAADERVRVRQLRSPHDSLLGRWTEAAPALVATLPRRTEPNIPSDRPREQHRLLAHQPNLRA